MFDTEKNAITEEIPLEGYHSDINDVAVDSNTNMVYVARTTATEERPEGITIINGTTNKVVYDIPNVGSDRVFVDSVKNIIYSLQWPGGIDIIDGQDYSIISHISFPLEDITACESHYDAAFNSKTGMMYISHRECNYISAFDLSQFQRKERPTIPTGEEIIHRPLLGVNNLPPPGMVPGRLVYHSISIKNYGTTEGQFLFLAAFPSIVDPDFKETASVGQIDILYSESNFIVYSSSLKPFESKFLAVPIKLRPEAVQFEQGELEEGKSIRVGDAFISAYIIELATLSSEDWSALKENFNGNALIERAIQLSLQNEEEFFGQVAPPLEEICNDDFDNDFDGITDENDCTPSKELKKVYDERFNQLLKTYDISPELADYVAWSVISSSLESLAVASLDRIDESHEFTTSAAASLETPTSGTTASPLEPLSFNDRPSNEISNAVSNLDKSKISHKIASPGGKGIPLCDNPVDCQIFESLKNGLQQAIHESRLDFFACVFGEESKGLFSNTVNSLSFGLVDIQFEGDHNLMTTGKTVGKAVSWAQFAVKAVPALASVGKTGWAGAKNIVANWKARQPIPGSSDYPVLWGREVVSSTGAAGNILKVAGAPANPKFDSTLDKYLVKTIGGGSKWYIGFGHNPAATQTVGGKLINPGWGHIYFWPFGKIVFFTGGKPLETKAYPVPALAARLAGLRLSLKGADPFGDYCSKVISAWDPNHLYASKEGYITSQETRPIQFTTTFENLENATALAYDVRIVASLDKSFDMSTFKSIAVSHPDKLQNVTLDDNKRQATWYFKDIALPPNKMPPEGEGWVKYSLAPLVNLTTDTVLKSQAQVFFDFNPLIETNTIEQKIDNDLPSTKVKQLQSETADSEFDLEIEGSDAGSGISSILILASNDAGQTYQILNATNGSSSGNYRAHFKGEPERTYDFVSVAVDNVGNVEVKREPDTSTTIKAAPVGGKCLIATAAFGSEIAPQVQLLRDFRDNYILSTKAGSRFMDVFNAWYYSFSPYVADYERQQPWLQNTIKAGIYPLLGVLTISEKAYTLLPGEYGSVLAGLIASSLIGAAYFWPAAFAVQRFGRHKKRMSYRLAIVLIVIAMVAAVISVVAANPAALMATTSFLVLTVVAISALFSSRLIVYVINKIIKKAR